MKSYILTIIVFLAAFVITENAHAQQQAPATASSHPITYEGGDGSSYDKAITIKGAPSNYIGDLAEYHWLTVEYPGYQLNKQSLYFFGLKTYDLLEFTTQDKQKKSIYFDISDFFGKERSESNPPR